MKKMKCFIFTIIFAPILYKIYDIFFEFMYSKNKIKKMLQIPKNNTNVKHEQTKNEIHYSKYQHDKVS